ncbi:MAG: DEAD/DEAH box helicase [Leptospiraceae bacterium]|nr:DEAD/DEAH box helicase [Leptospiraceae bacterium]
MKFEELNLHENLLKAIQELNFEKMTPIQEIAIPLALEGKDIMGLAQTGTGKTISFLVPIIQKIITQNEEQTSTLVLAPTRELVLQIYEEAKRLLKYTDKKAVAIIGGTDYNEQLKGFQEGAHILIATPGRLIDHMKSKALDLRNIRYLVLDEADRMLDMGFIKDITYVMRKCSKERQTMLYSATLSYYVMRIAYDYLKDPVEAKIDSESIVTEKIDQILYHLASEEKLPYLVNLILNDNEEGLGIIFTNYKVSVGEIVDTLRKYGIRAVGLSSNFDQKRRVKLLKEFRQGNFTHLVATDVASRGLDIENVKVVYNYDLPQDVENYVHRIGRTARAGKTGRSISFCSERDYNELEKIQKFLGNKIPVGEIKEEFLKYPEGDFSSVQVQEETKKEKTNFKKREKGFSKKEKFKKQPQKKPQILDEAIEYLQKADEFFELKESKKEKSKPSKFKKPEKKKKKQKTKEKEALGYDKSKRNLFDINDAKQEETRKPSLWERFKSLFGL